MLRLIEIKSKDHSLSLSKGITFDATLRLTAFAQRINNFMQKYIIGLDVGATKIAAGLVSANGKIVKKFIISTETKRGKKIILKNILTAASKVWLPGVLAIGVGIAGQCDFRRGIFVAGPNFPKNFKNINIKKFLEKEFRVPIFLDNDARAFTLAESIYGAGRHYKNIVGVTLGTGIGGGIVMNGQLVHGEKNTAGEIGHMTIDASSPYRCSCGRFGHFEALASGRAMRNFYKKLTGRPLNTFEIENKFYAGDRAAKKVFTLMPKYLATGLTNLIHVLNPDIIILGGGLSRVSALWLPALRIVKNEVIYKSLKNTKIVKTKLGDDAGIIGAALLTEKLR